jgi:formylglycine-generating enzyme required for sulfatase activity
MEINFSSERFPKMRILMVILLLSFVFVAIADEPHYKICPICGKIYQIEYQYCPLDGTKLEMGGVSAKKKEEKPSPSAQATQQPTSGGNIASTPIPNSGSIPAVETPISQELPVATTTPLDLEQLKAREPAFQDASVAPAVGQGCGKDMAYVPSGSFDMGSDNFPYPKDAKYLHSVFIDSFCIDKFEYPNKMFEKPTSRLNYFEAESTCTKEGKRLCTEAEWEKACKGPQFYEYPYGMKYDQIACWINKNTIDGSANSGDKAKCRSAYGVYDMSGNMEEWVSDYYDANYYQTSPQSNPKGPDKGIERVLKGGSWADFGMRTKCSYRNKKEPDFRARTIGVRCCKKPE